jgi:AcrR family transcriptional regulator
MYHQFADKAALFGEVAEAVEADVTTRLGAHVVASGAGDPVAALHAAVDGWLEACEEPEVRQVLLLDAPVVLGWDGFRDVALRHGLGLTEAMLRAAIDAGQLPDQPTRALAHVLIGALDEAAMYVATADDRDAARSEVAEVLHTLLEGLLGR